MGSIETIYTRIPPASSASDLQTASSLEDPGQGLLGQFFSRNQPDGHHGIWSGSEFAAPLSDNNYPVQNLPWSDNITINLDLLRTEIFTQFNAINTKSISTQKKKTGRTEHYNCHVVFKEYVLMKHFLDGDNPGVLDMAFPLG